MNFKFIIKYKFKFKWKWKYVVTYVMMNYKMMKLLSQKKETSPVISTFNLDGDIKATPNAVLDEPSIPLVPRLQ